MKVFIPAYFITSGHSVQKWKGTDMESMRDTKRIMEREIKKGSTPLSFEQMEIDTNNYQEITSVEKLTQVLQYLHRVGNYKSLAGKTVINNVYTFMRGRTPDFTRARSIFDREKIYHQMLRQEISFEVHGFSPFLYREVYSVAPPFGCGTGTGGG